LHLRIGVETRAKAQAMRLLPNPPYLFALLSPADLNHAYDLAKRLARINNAKDFCEYNPVLERYFHQSPTANFARSVPTAGRPNGAVLSALTQAFSDSEAQRGTHRNLSKRKDH
jgi:hypothetical protein